MLLIVVCDARKHFTIIATGIPGSVHDQRVMDMTHLGSQLKAFPNEYFQNKNLHILGDSVFALRMNIMTP